MSQGFVWSAYFIQISTAEVKYYWSIVSSPWKTNWGRKRPVHVRFQALTAASIKTTAFWDIAPCSLIQEDRRSRLPPSPWWWRQYAPLKHRSTSIRLYGATSHDHSLPEGRPTVPVFASKNLKQSTYIQPLQSRWPIPSTHSSKLVYRCDNTMRTKAVLQGTVLLHQQLLTHSTEKLHSKFDRPQAPVHSIFQ
jgi:hypothetical protein